MNGLSKLVVTKLDVLDDFREVRVAVGYERDGRPVRGFPASARVLGECTPVWRSFPGWNTPTTGARRWSDLPPAARDYLEWLEREIGVPIGSVSVGAERHAEVPRS